MADNMLKGVAWLAMILLATLGALTFLPESAWESCPPPLSPLRSSLAKFCIAPEKYRAKADDAELTVAPVDENACLPNGGDDSLCAESRVQIASPPSRPRILEERGEPVDSPVRSRFAGVATDLQDSGLPSTDLSADDSLLSQSSADADPLAAPENLSDSPLDDPIFNGSGDGLDESLTTLADPPQSAEFTEANALLSDHAQETASQQNASDSLNVAATPAVEAQNENGALSVAPMPEGIAESSPSSAPQQPSQENPASQPRTLAEAGAAMAAPASPAPAATTPAATTPAHASATQSSASCANPVQTPLDPAACATAATPTLSELIAAKNYPAALNLALNGARDVASAAQAREIFVALNMLRRYYVAQGQADVVARINATLDCLAFEIFYNPKRAILEPMRQTLPGETLESIAKEYNVSPETIAVINGVKLPADSPLPPGAQLKVFRGPVAAEISASRKELLLTFNGLYAGRFKCGIPRQDANFRGTCDVETLIEKPSCDAVDLSGSKITIPGGSPENPLGAYWIGLSGGHGLQGTNRAELIGTDVPENGGFIFSNREISQLKIFLVPGTKVYFTN